MKTITVQIPAKQFYETEFASLCANQKSLKAEIAELNRTIRWASNELQNLKAGHTASAITVDRAYIANNLDAAQIACLMGLGYRFGVGDWENFNGEFDGEAILFKWNVPETEQETLARNANFESRSAEFTTEIKEATDNVSKLQEQLAKIEEQIKGFWKDPERQANLKSN